MLYTIKKLAKLSKKSITLVRLALDRYNIEKTVVDKAALFELDSEQLKKVMYFLKYRKDLDEVKEKQKLYLQKVKNYLK
jgi:hypothetical protein